MADKDSFEWISPASGVPIVSLAEYGLTLNRAAIERLRTPESVRIGVDGKRKLVAVRPADDGSNKGVLSAFPLKGRIRDGYVRIASRDLVRYIVAHCPELNLSKTRRFAAVVDGDMLVIDLRCPLGRRDNGAV